MKHVAYFQISVALGSSGCVPRQNGNLCASFSFLNSSTLTSCCICVVKFPLTIILRMSLAWIYVFVYFLNLAAYILQYLEEGRAACSSILAWRIPVDSSEELGVLQSMGSQRIGGACNLPRWEPLLLGNQKAPNQGPSHPRAECMADLFWNHCFHIQIEHSHFSPFLINWNYSKILLTHRLITFKDLEFRVKNLEHRILHFRTKKAINTIILLS